MFPEKRFITRGVFDEVPTELQLFMWRCIDELTIEADWLQVFTLTADGKHQCILHEQECPPYSKNYWLTSHTPTPPGCLS